MRKIYLFLPLLILGLFFVFSSQALAAYGDTTTFVGKLYAGDGGPATDSFLDFPHDVAFDASGNLYIADTYNNVIRKITPEGLIYTHAGCGKYGYYNASAELSEFALPKGVTVDSSGNVFVADTGNNMIRKVDVYGSVSTYISSGLSSPEGILAQGDYLYIADTGNNAIKKVNRSNGAVYNLTTSISSPRKMAISSDGSTLYVADEGNNRVIKVNTSTGSVSLIAGSSTSAYEEGTGSNASFRMVYGIAYDASSGYLYVTDEDENRIGVIRKINPETGETTQFAYDSSMTSIYPTSGVRIHGDYIYLAGNGTIHRYNKNDASDNEVYVGSDRFGYRNGYSTSALIGRPYDMVKSPDGNYIYLAENNKIRKINLSTGYTSFVIGNSVDSYNNEEGTGSAARFSNISGITINSSGDTLYVADRWNNRIRGVNIANQSSFLVSGSGDTNVTGSGNGYQEGTKNTTLFDIPANLVISPDDQYLYVSDTGNNRIRKVRISDGQTWLIAGSGEAGFADGMGAAAKFNHPYGIDIDSSGQYLYVADRDNHRIRRVKISTGKVTTVAGDGRNGYLDGLASRAVFSYPVYVKYYANKVFVSESGSHRVRLVELNSDIVKLVAGSGTRGFHNSSRTDTKFNNLMGMVIDNDTKYLYVCDSWNDMIRKINIRGVAPYTSEAPVVSSVSPNRLSVTDNSDYQAYLDLYGQNFRHGATTYFGDHEAISYVKSSEQMTVVIPLGQMSGGYYDVKVENTDGQSDLLSVGFTVTNSSGQVPHIFYSLESGDGFKAYSSLYTGGVKTATADLDGDGTAEIVTGTSQGGGPHVRVFDSLGNIKSQFFAYQNSFRGGFNLDIGDVDGDGQKEIVTAAGPGGGPHVRIFDMNGNLENQFFAYALAFRRGVNLAVGDVNGDGVAEIATGTMGASAPHVRIFNGQGSLIDQFFAYPEHFRIGINVLISDVNNNGQGEVITAPYQSGGPHIRVFESNGNLISQFFAYAQAYRGGVNLASGDVDGNGTQEIITGTSFNKAPHVRMLDINGGVVGQFFAFSSSNRNGVYVSSGDVNNDGLDEIITSEMSGAPEVVQFDYMGYLIE
ncbi:MAG: hypothetical protein U5L76_03260 [Patescibacteria group bacterium]|nr:hypothetical protein [Patescibacteria group bacterium]